MLVTKEVKDISGGIEYVLSGATAIPPCEVDIALRRFYNLFSKTYTPFKMYSEPERPLGNPDEGRGPRDPSQIYVTHETFFIRGVQILTELRKTKTADALKHLNTISISVCPPDEDVEKMINTYYNRIKD